MFLGSDIGWVDVMEYHDADHSCTISMSELSHVCAEHYTQCRNFLDSSHTTKGTCSAQLCSALALSLSFLARSLALRRFLPRSLLLVRASRIAHRSARALAVRFSYVQLLPAPPRWVHAQTVR